MKKALLVFALVMLSGIGAWADTFEVNGVYYDITSESTVCVGNNSYYKGNPDLVIPATVTYNNKEYTVTGFYPEGSFTSNNILRSVTIPSTIEIIGNSAFANCTNLKSVKLPNTITQIGNAAFVNCSALTSFTIPASVTEIVRDALSGCTGLEYVICEGETPPAIGIDAFYDCNAYILVPGPSLSSYKSTWKTYVDKISPIEVINIARKIALGTLNDEQTGPTIEVTGQDDKVIKLYNPKNVKFTK